MRPRHWNFTEITPPLNVDTLGGLSLEQFEADNTQTNQPQGVADSNTALGAMVFKKDLDSSTLLAKFKYDAQFDCWFIDAGAWF